METLWTWGGRYFGYREGNDLWTHGGKHVGRFHENEVYSAGGKYLGELQSGKLVTNKSKRSRTKSGFVASPSKSGLTKLSDDVGLAMVGGNEEFPRLEG